MRPKLVTIASFNTPGEANIARNYLEAAGVQAFLADESAATMAWHLSGAIGGIKLQVADRDVAKAQAFLRADRGELPADDFDDLHHDAADIPPSPTDAMLNRASRAAVLGLLFLPLQLYSLWLLCRICAHQPKPSAHQPKPSGQRLERILFVFLLDLPVLLVLLFAVWNIVNPSCPKVCLASVSTPFTWFGRQSRQAAQSTASALRPLARPLCWRPGPSVRNPTLKNAKYKTCRLLLLW